MKRTKHKSKPKPKRTFLAVDLHPDPELTELLDRYVAETPGTNRSSVTREALREFIENRQKN